MARWSASALVVAALMLGACHAGYSPELRVLGVHEQPARDVVFVQVTNPASHAMRLTRLEYAFAADGATVSTGALALAREVSPGEAIVVEIPFDGPSAKAMTMSGTLTTEINQIVQNVSVSAQIKPGP